MPTCSDGEAGESRKVIRDAGEESLVDGWILDSKREIAGFILPVELWTSS